MHNVVNSRPADIVDDARATPAIIMSAAGAALGGLLFGFDTAVISGATGALQTQFALTEASLGFTVASALIGTVLGSLISGMPADRYGRKAIMLSVAIAYVVSSLGTALAHDWPVLIAFRFLGGVAIGPSERASDVGRRFVPGRLLRAREAVVDADDVPTLSGPVLSRGLGLLR